MPYVNGGSPVPVREEFIGEHLWEVDIIVPSEGLRTKEWKYFRYRNDRQHEELYHLLIDPQEAHNLAGKKQYKGKLQEMRKRFDRLATRLEKERLD